ELEVQRISACHVGVERRGDETLGYCLVVCKNRAVVDHLHLGPVDVEQERIADHIPARIERDVERQVRVRRYPLGGEGQVILVAQEVAAAQMERVGRRLRVDDIPAEAPGGELKDAVRAIRRRYGDQTG